MLMAASTTLLLIDQHLEVGNSLRLPNLCSLLLALDQFQIIVQNREQLRSLQHVFYQQETNSFFRQVVVLLFDARQVVS